LEWSSPNLRLSILELVYQLRAATEGRPLQYV
jgi:hypothetical protein